MATKLTLVHPPCEAEADPGLVAKVKLTGRTLADLLDALDRVRQAVADEAPFGHGNNVDGSFQFSVEGIGL